MPPLSNFERFLRSGRRKGVATPPPSTEAWDALHARLVAAGASQVVPASEKRRWSLGYGVVLVLIVALLAGGAWWWSGWISVQGPQEKSGMPVILPVPSDTVLANVGPRDTVFAGRVTPVGLTDNVGTLSAQLARQTRLKTSVTAMNPKPMRLLETSGEQTGQVVDVLPDLATNEIENTVAIDTISSGEPTTILQSDTAYQEADIAATRPPLVRDKIMAKLPDPVLRVAPTIDPLDRLPTVQGEKMKYSYTGKPKARAEWQVIAAYNSIFSYYPYGLWENFYSRDFTPSSPRTFVMPSGESFSGWYSGGQSFSSFKANSFYFRSGISRQTGDGFYFSAELGAYKGYSRRRSDDYEQVGRDEIRLDADRKEFMLTYSIGMQYTFLKRHRFRPYLGVQGLGFLYYYGQNETTFFDGQTQTAGLERRFTTRQYFLDAFDFALLAGFQYKFTQRFSVGVSLFANGGYDYFLEAPVGVEVRYSLK